MSEREFIHPLLGTVHLRQSSRTRRISAKWRNGEVYLTIPRGLGASTTAELLEKLVPRLLKSRPTKSYHDGQQLEFDGLTILIKRQEHLPKKIIAKAGTPLSVIEAGSDLDLTQAETTKAISKILCRIARTQASGILLPRAKALAQRLGKQPKSWSISGGHRILGRCSSSGAIALSYMILFLPMHLRDYVVCHELAHLDEMNHSSRFHELCNRYCSGKEAQYAKQLRGFDWPVLR